LSISAESRHTSPGWFIERNGMFVYVPRMRFLSISCAAFLVAAVPAAAQVTVDLGALSALPERSGTSRPMRAVPAPTASGPVASASTPIATPVSPRPDIPEHAPDVASLAPIVPPPVPEGTAPPAPPPVSDKSATSASATTVGLRLTFATGETDLSPDSVAAIKDAAAKLPPGDETTFNVLSYAAGKPDDPSTSRRLSLSRAMAVRGALVADGVPSARIFVRALGEKAGDGPADRVDLTITGLDKAATR
jgi:outer membrane protein OmpA-like peptidoglycan-associated protein